MKFLIQNTTSENKFITRFGGDKICIPKNDFIEFDSDDALECKYWSNLVYNPVDGLKVITNTARIKLLNKMKSCGKYGNISNTVTEVPKKVEPVIENVKEEIVEVPVEPVTTTESVNNTEEVTVENVPEEVITEEETVEEVSVTEPTTTFTEEELSTKSKNELYTILDTYGIKYKKNYSVSRLINLILDNVNNSED